MNLAVASGAASPISRAVSFATASAAFNSTASQRLDFRRGLDWRITDGTGCAPKQSACLRNIQRTFGHQNGRERVTIEWN